MIPIGTDSNANDIHKKILNLKKEKPQHTQLERDFHVPFFSHINLKGLFIHTRKKEKFVLPNHYLIEKQEHPHSLLPRMI